MTSLDCAENWLDKSHRLRTRGFETSTDKPAATFVHPSVCIPIAGQRSQMMSSNEYCEINRQAKSDRSESADCWIVVTDLDGTLLDRTYDLTAAARVLNQLLTSWSVVQKLVLATSKTLTELEPLASLLDQPAVLIYENGAGYTLTTGPGEQCTTKLFNLTDEARDYEAIRAVLVNLREHHGFDFTGFGDMSSRQVSNITGLDIEGAKRARQRSASEPLLWSDDETRLKSFRKLLAAKGLVLVSGGQFHHVSAAVDKWEAVNQWRQSSLPHARILACGDAHNDERLLKAADQSLVFPRADGSYQLPQSETVRHVSAPGPAEWSTAVNKALSERPSINPATEARQ